MEMLKIKMVTLERCVVMYILEQDESLRGMDSYCFGKFTFKSFNLPEIERYSIFLRGMEPTEDTRPCFIRFDDNEERDEWLKDFREAFNAFEEYLLKNIKTGDKSVPDEDARMEIFEILSKGE